MRTLLLLLAIALLPVASADPAASVRALEGDAECTSGGWWDSGHEGNSSGNESWGWDRYETSAYAKCRDDFDYARVEAGDASLAASAHHDNASTYDSSWSSWWSTSPAGSWGGSESSYAWSQEDSWDRTVTAQAGATSATASRGCSSSWSDSERHSSTSSPDSRYASADRDSSNSNRCEQAAVGSGPTGRAAVYDACSSRSHEDARSSSWGDETESSTWGSSDWRCEAGVDADAADAGFGNGCSSQGWRSEWGNSTSEGAWSRCETGAFARGPDGMALFVGGVDDAYSSCYDGECGGASWRNAGVLLTWEHNPVGPGPMGVWLPLP